MSSKPEELTITYTEEGVDVVKELDKVILSKGAWTTIIFRFQEWDRSKEIYGADKYTIRRYQKRSGEYQQKSKFNISSKDQAKALIEALQQWMDD
jgi:muconolactone delta-isomerase